MNDLKTEIVGSYIREVSDSIHKLPMDTILQIAEVIDDARFNRKRVFIFGNGGSAATASHFACDLAKGGIVPREPRLRVVALTDNMPLFSAWANDSCYDNVFSEQLENLVESGDIVIGISGSGNSPNVLNAIRLARLAGAFTIAFAGFNGGKVKDVVNLCLTVPNYCMEQVEDIHLVLAHMITLCVRTRALEQSVVRDLADETQVSLTDSKDNRSPAFLSVVQNTR